VEFDMDKDELAERLRFGASARCCYFLLGYVEAEILSLGRRYSMDPRERLTRRTIGVAGYGLRRRTHHAG
jgi:hypothetical protein